MNPFTESPIKENMRLQNENTARIQEQQIRTRLNEELSKIVDTEKLPFALCVILAIICGILVIVVIQIPDAFLIGAAIGVVIYIVYNTVVVSSQNKQKENTRSVLRSNADDEIANAYRDADNRTMKQVADYENAVNNCCQKILKNPSEIESMIQHNTIMFQRMVSHADDRAHQRFIEADLHFTVQMTGIKYTFPSNYSNPQDFYDFNEHRFWPLKSDEECEGLAQALSMLTGKRMITLYPPNSLNISVSHVDADVVLHFKSANKNFVVAKPLFTT